jgi:peptidoglycan hydrolase-like protein with peptidoglycan-binding domain
MKMKRALILAATVASLSLPAMAQTNTNSNQTSSQPSQMNNSQSMQQQGRQSTQQQAINPEQLSSQQVREIQTALKKQGFETGKADGKWGSETEAAVKKFQQKKNLQGNGQLDEQTLSALGVNVSPTESTGSSANESNSPSSSHSTRQ